MSDQIDVTKMSMLDIIARGMDDALIEKVLTTLNSGDGADINTILEFISSRYVTDSKFRYKFLKQMFEKGYDVFLTLNVRRRNGNGWQCVCN
nr:MAG TPA: linker histone H1 and H5 family [Caudoviricetes sp.]